MATLVGGYSHDPFYLQIKACLLEVQLKRDGVKLFTNVRPGNPVSLSPSFLDSLCSRRRFKTTSNWEVDYVDNLRLGPPGYSKIMRPIKRTASQVT